MAVNASTETAFEKLRIAIADDNAAMRGIVRTVLTGFGVQAIYEAADAQAALDIVRAESIDVLICDWKMTPVDGLTLVRTLRDPKRSPSPLLPVIMLTAYGETDRVQQARDAGVTEYMVKPFCAEGLYARLRAIVNRPRPFVRTREFFGPDRRRLSAGFDGPERREDAAI